MATEPWNNGGIVGLRATIVVADGLREEAYSGLRFFQLSSWIPERQDAASATHGTLAR